WQRRIALGGRDLGFDSFLRLAREIARHHHERWDGTGYPDGLREEEIPVSARLMAVADVYDALVSRRVYKEAFSPGKARELILAWRARHLDPAVVDAFIEIESEFLDIVAEYPDTAPVMLPND
ncbi:HD-GYP domain-containing protein, partial [Candidatus Hydrogenedentota bacterium]